MHPMFEPAKFIGAAVVPAGMISAGGVFFLAPYKPLAAIVARLRAISRERMRGEEMAKPLAEEGEGHFSPWVRRMLGRGAQGVLGRAKLVRDALTCLIGAVLCMAMCSLAGGLATVWG